MKWLDDVIRDPKTGHVVARDLQKFAAFVAALLWGGLMAYLRWALDRELTAEPMYALLAYSGGLQYIKARQTSGAGLPAMGAEEPPPAAGAPTSPTPAA